MENQISLLRKEVFGGTLYNSVVGKRLYITIEEYNEVKQFGTLTQRLCQELAVFNPEVKIIEPSWIPENNFSSPDALFFEITRFCNLTCVHCFNNSGQKLKEELTSEEISNFLIECSKMGVQEIRFTGGEPMAVKDIFNYIRIIRNLGLKASIGTNGTTISKKVAKQLADAGLNAAIVSIDGEEALHDSIRGKGSFVKTLQGIENLKDAGVFVRVNTVAMRKNFFQIPKIAEFFYSRKIHLNIRRFIPGGRASGMWDEMLNNDDYAVLRKQLGPYLNDSNKLVRGHYLQDTPAFSARIDLPFTFYHCTAGQRGMVILPDGNVQTCGFLGPLGESTLGNIRNEGLDMIWKRLVNSSHIDSLRNLLPDYNKNQKNVCTNCLAIGLAASESPVQIDLSNIKTGGVT